jgi:hypothetical protein
MSSNRLSYDSCAYNAKIDVSKGPMIYALYSGKYENSAKCRIEFGTVGGNGVSLYSGNLVDLESDLRGQTRASSDCASKKYSPSQSPVKLAHQPSCQIQYYPKVQMPMPGSNSSCNYRK